MTMRSMTFEDPPGGNNHCVDHDHVLNVPGSVEVYQREAPRHRFPHTLKLLDSGDLNPRP